MKTSMLMKEIKANLKSRGLEIAKYNSTFNGAAMWKVWNPVHEGEQNAHKFFLQRPGSSNNSSASKGIRMKGFYLTVGDTNR